ncbi:MAG: alpha/beta fold hydrolase [Kiritimatiellae bacterium]|nr:alpha/beta fold hydrolase [Kiritimatiellia bacterium]MDD4341094.1 alpha/beta fold hydrolase [Kiritimatiellia bacterium]
MDWAIDGQLVAFPVADGRMLRRRDGFYRPGSQADAPLLIFVHGMGSNFYRSELKKAFLEMAPAFGMGVLSFNNAGAERETETERFGACLHDLDGAAEFARRRGHRTLILVGHSTGCQKIVYWQARRQHPAVAGLVLLAPADDHAILRRDFGRRFDGKVAWARRQVEAGRPEALVTGLYQSFGAARFLSVANPRATEAGLFRYDGPLTYFRRIRCPLLAVFGENEEFAVIPPAEMLAILRRKSTSVDFTDWLVPAADHGFHECQVELALAICEWAREAAW